MANGVPAIFYRRVAHPHCPGGRAKPIYRNGLGCRYGPAGLAGIKASFAETSRSDCPKKGRTAQFQERLHRLGNRGRLNPIPAFFGSYHPTGKA
jgi:hypothetical protein